MTAIGSIGAKPASSERSRSRCVWVAVAAVLLAGVATSASAGCPPPYTAVGQAGSYSISSGSYGACGLPNTDGVTAAIASSRWIGSGHCGECLDVSGPLGSTIVQITDECVGCTHDLDMTPAAFAKIANPAQGLANISWQRVDCPVSGGITIQVANSINAFYFSALVENTLQGVAGVAFAPSGSGTFQPLTRETYNYFDFSGTVNNYPLTLRLTSQSGEALQLSASINMTSGAAYVTNQQFEGCTDRIFASDFGSTL